MSLNRPFVVVAFQCISWFLLVVLLAPSALAAHCSSLEFSTSLPSPTRAEPGRQSAEWGGDAFLSSSEAGGRARSEGEAQPAQAQAPPLELNVGHHLCAEQAGGWGLTLPEIGRYLSPEPLGLMGGLSPFGYAANDPIHLVDPDGLAPVFASCIGNKPHTRGTNSLRGSSSSTRYGNERNLRADETLHPVVSNAITGTSLEGTRRPDACADPYALSDYLKAYEERHGPLDPNDREGVGAALSSFRFQAKEEGGPNRAPCRNCSQMFANLMAEYGAPDPSNIKPGRMTGGRGHRTNFTPPTDEQLEQNPRLFQSYGGVLKHFHADQ